MKTQFLDPEQKSKMFIPFKEQGDCKGENVWVEVIEIRINEEQQEIMMKAKLLNEPLIGEDINLHFGDIVLANRQDMPTDRWVFCKKFSPSSGEEKGNL